MNAYAARICWNSKGWVVPTGEAADLESVGPSHTTYVQDHRFGHEEWLFNFQWVIDDWKYSFLQPVNKSWEKVHSQKLDIFLYAIGPKSAWYYVGRIPSCEVLSESQAKVVRGEFERRGWLAQMRAQVRVVGGDVEALDDGMLFNVRFRPADAEVFDPVAAGNEDVVRGWRRYTLVSLDGENAPVRARWPHRAGTTEVGKTGLITKHSTPAGTMDLAHADLQHELYSVLAKRYGKASVIKEENFVDVKVRRNGEVTLVEVKTDPLPMRAIRQGMGQLLEYAFGCRVAGESVTQLVIAAPGEVSELDRLYVEHLRSERGLPIKYVCFRLGMTEVDLD